MAFPEAVAAAAAEAAARLGVQRVRGELAGLCVELEFVGSALQRWLLPALPPAEGPPVARIVLWDGAESGVPLPPRPWSEAVFTLRGDAPPDCLPPGWRAAFRPWAAELSLLDPAGEIGHFHTQDATRLRSDYSGAPLLVLAGWLAPRAGWRLAHAAAVGLGDEGVLLAGAGGSGKSTSALACLAAGWAFLGDDYCRVRATPEPAAARLYRSAKIDATHLAWTGLLAGAPQVQPRDAEAKAVLLPAEGSTAPQLRETLRLRALVAPKIDPTADAPRLERLSPAAALRALAPSTLCQLAGAGPEHFAELTRLAQQLPCHRLWLGRRVAQIPDLLATLLR
ncbi:MAG: hypothetical protein MUE46_14640 [Xanthomonadales bacterium]|jgi:hypothetical protein|nr:hypothetical protein [Xanthomonadales bacterium]